MSFILCVCLHPKSPDTFTIAQPSRGGGGVTAGAACLHFSNYLKTNELLLKDENQVQRKFYKFTNLMEKSQFGEVSSQGSQLPL